MDTASAPAAVIDVRTIPWADRLSRILASFASLQPSEAIEIVYDHDPLPLRDLFEQTRQGLYGWHYVEAGPELWRVRIGMAARR
jgi:uncharacterized protein (DUF2249 family)